MKEQILKYQEQFEFDPIIENSHKLKENYQNFILAGMGGSHLSAGLIKIFRPGINLTIHSDYGLPNLEDEIFSKSLLIASSYSGNTEEVVDFFESAYSKGYDVAVVTSGGKLLEMAKEREIPYVEMPNIGIQPRLALGFSSLAISSFVDSGLTEELKSLSSTLDPESLEDQADLLANQIGNKIPIIYTSNLNQDLGYVWKITLNETAKIPAFSNVFPEINHNEMQAFDTTNDEAENQFIFFIIHDSEDHPKIELRMRTVESLLEERGHQVVSLFLEGESITEKIFNSLILIHLVAVNVAENNGVDPESVALIEEFKKRVL